MAEKRDKLFAEWFWTDRWTGSRGYSLPMEARGLYREMLTQAWKRGAKLPNDHEAIRRITACTEKEWKRCWPQVEPFWTIDGDALVNVTQVVFYGEAKAAADAARARAQAGAHATNKQRSSGAQATAQAMPKPSPERRSLITDSDLRASKEHSLSAARVDDRPGKLREELYPTWYSRYRNGARLSLIASPLEYQSAVKLCETWDDARLEKLAKIVLTTDDPFIAGTDRGFRIFAMKATWADDRLAAWEKEHGVKA